MFDATTAHVRIPSVPGNKQERQQWVDLTRSLSRPRTTGNGAQQTAGIGTGVWRGACRSCGAGWRCSDPAVSWTGPLNPNAIRSTKLADGPPRGPHQHVEGLPVLDHRRRVQASLPSVRASFGRPGPPARATLRPSWQLGAVIFLFSRFPSRHTNSLPLVDHPHSLPAVDVLDHDPLLTPATLARKCVGQLRRAAGHLVRSAEHDLTNRRVEPGQSC